MTTDEMKSRITRLTVRVIHLKNQKLFPNSAKIHSGLFIDDEIAACETEIDELLKSLAERNKNNV